ncbi:MAG: Lrp/AsnC family transcriptional regulator [Actinomycetota bacterium]
MDETDRQILHLLQRDATLSVREVGEAVGLSPTPCWRRIKKLEDDGVIAGRVALVRPESVNLGVTALVMIRTNEHTKDWLARFVAGVQRFEEVVEAFRTSGEIDYLLKVRVPDIAAYDAFYQRLIEEVDLYDVRSTFVMEEIKNTTTVPLQYAGPA